MTFLEALRSLEKRIDKLNVKFPDGDRMEWQIAWAKVGAYFRTRSDWADEQLKNGAMDISEWYLEHMKMIEEYSRRPRGNPWD